MSQQIVILNIEQEQTVPIITAQTIPVPGAKGDKGSGGDSAYQTWLNAGNTGSEDAFILAIKGEKGDKGDDGANGYTPIKGVDYFDGETGVSTWNELEGKPLTFMPEAHTQAISTITNLQSELDKKIESYSETDPVYLADKPLIALKTEIPDITVKSDKSTTYTKTEVDNKISAIPTPDVSAQITSHNASETAHNDLRTLIDGKQVAGDYATNTAMANKVDKIDGKGLSAEDYTTAEKTKLTGIEAGAQVNPDLSNYITGDVLDNAYNSILSEANQYVDTNFQVSLNAGTNIALEGSNISAIVPVQSVCGKTGNVSLDINDFLTSTEYETLSNTSGVNTGDETASGIKTKLETLTGTNRLSPTAIKNLTGKNFKMNDVSTGINVSMANSLSLIAGNTTLIPLGLKNSDNLGEFNISTYRFSPSFTQECWVDVVLSMTNAGVHYLSIYKDGSLYINYYFEKTLSMTHSLYFPSGSYYDFRVTSNITNTLNAYPAIQISTRGTY